LIGSGLKAAGSVHRKWVWL